jgi:diguanylate cyclase (GGDEF)-like protein/PAS domain S-box-containing protein
MPLKPDNLLNIAVENFLEAFYLCARDGRIVHVNQSACHALGYTYEELTSLRTSDIDPSEVIEVNGTARIDGMPLTRQRGIFESRHRRKDGTTFPVEITYNDITIEGVDYIFAFARDISVRKQTEWQREELRRIVDHAIDAVFVFDRSGRILYANQSAVTESGYSRATLLSMTIMDLDPVLTRETWETGWSKVLAGQENILESVHKRKDGTTYPVEISVWLADFGGVQSASAFVRNITERKRLNQEAEALRFVVEKSVDQILIYDQTGKFYYVNESACKMLGYSRAEFMRLTVFDIVTGLSRDASDRYWEERRKGGMMMLESVHRAKDGRLIPVEVTANTMIIDGKEYSCAIVRDISERKAAMQKLEILQFAIDNSIVPVYFYDDQANITYANKSACQALGYTLEELTRLKVFDMDPNVTPEVWKVLYPNVKTGKAGTISSTNKRKDGTVFPVAVTPTNMSFGDMEFGCSVNLDVSAKVAAEQALRESEEKFRVIADTSPVALIIHRVSDGAILYANRAAGILFDRDSAAMIGTPVTSLIENEDSRKVCVEIITGRNEVHGRELMLNSRDGQIRWASLNAKRITLQGEQAVCCALQDVTEAHNLSLQLSYQAAYDALTGLVNRREFETRLTRAVKSVAVKGTEHAMCFLDLDQFKVINDTCGHIAGDELLRQLGHVLRTHVRKRDTLARLGGDEFAVLLENCSLTQAKRVANTIREAIQNYRFLWDNKAFGIGVSIGLVAIDLPDEGISEVLRRADVACYQAKERGRNRVHVYHADDEELTLRQDELHWVSRITSALEQNRLQIWSQKILSLSNPNARREHYELLVRMVDKNGQIVPPGAFLPAAERYNLVSRIDRWVINRTLRWFSRHPEKYKRLKLCSMNLSGQSLCDEDFLADISASFARYKLDPEKFSFEVAETTAIANLNSATHFINSLKKLGCSFALDDFGSGLSSFAYLKNLPVDFIKIDGVFIKDLHADPLHLALVKSINDIGHVMGRKTIAEFVENKQILKKLRTLGVDHAQGYGIARPELMIDGVTDERTVN